MWPEEDERGPVATERHARLVARLEELVAGGGSTPTACWATMRPRWPTTNRSSSPGCTRALEDGREPIWAVTDEEDEAFFAAWADANADADARPILAGVGDATATTPLPARPI